MRAPAREYLFERLLRAPSAHIFLTLILCRRLPSPLLSPTPPALSSPLALLPHRHVECLLRKAPALPCHLNLEQPHMHHFHPSVSKHNPREQTMSGFTYRHFGSSATENGTGEMDPLTSTRKRATRARHLSRGAETAGGKGDGQSAAAPEGARRRICGV